MIITHLFSHLFATSNVDFLFSFPLYFFRRFFFNLATTTAEKDTGCECSCHIGAPPFSAFLLQLYLDSVSTAAKEEGRFCFGRFFFVSFFLCHRRHHCHTYERKTQHN